MIDGVLMAVSAGANRQIIVFANHHHFRIAHFGLCRHELCISRLETNDRFQKLAETPRKRLKNCFCVFEEFIEMYRIFSNKRSSKMLFKNFLRIEKDFKNFKNSCLRIFFKKFEMIEKFSFYFKNIRIDRITIV